MTKNQVNYLLILATLFIFWLFFNTFYMGAKMQSKFPMPMGRPGMAMPAQPGYPFSSYSQSGREMSQPGRQATFGSQYRPGGIPPEAQKMLAERQDALNASVQAPLPVQPKKEKK